MPLAGSERETFPLTDGEKRQIALLADRIMEQFGGEDGLAGIGRRDAEHLAKNWLRQIGSDEHSKAR
jgi:hypothetical protein